MKDIRWKQRFDNYTNALQTLSRAVELSRQRALSELEQQGVIQGFEFTHELAWNVLKDYLEEQGFVGIVGSRNATREFWEIPGTVYLIHFHAGPTGNYKSKSKLTTVLFFLLTREQAFNR